MNKFFYFIVPVLLVMSCRSDDDGVIQVPPRDLSEVVAEDEAEIRTFLRTHFYNYEQFQNPPADFDFKIVIDTIAGDNADRTSLMDVVDENGQPRLRTGEVSISASDFILNGEENIAHTYYYLVAREGTGASPTVGDSTFVRFKGSSLLEDGSLSDFDEVEAGGVWFDLPIFQIPGPGGSRAFRGVGEGLQQLRGGGNIVDNPDGTFEIEGFGVGFVIFPSGLGTFNGFRSPIPQYTPLIFTLEMLVVEEADHDNDGIPSFMEDANNDGLLFNDNTDNDVDAIGAQISNYLDVDDDGDGIRTRDEIIINAEGVVSFLDTDTDGISDHLDDDDDNDGRPTIEEIVFNANGTVETPDSDGDGTPDYLDADS